jgi:hypothetical protein
MDGRNKWNEAPRVWYTIIGDGGAITASTCATGTDFDSQTSVFAGGSCDQVTCDDGNNDARGGSQSLVVIQSIQDQTYHALVHGYGSLAGNFALRINPTRSATLPDLLVDYKAGLDPSLTRPFLAAICSLGLNDQQ